MKSDVLCALVVTVLFYHQKSFCQTVGSKVQTVYNGKIEKIPICKDTTCKKCSPQPIIASGRNCATCPICGPPGTSLNCPAYKCSSCPKIQLYDKDGCFVCQECPTNAICPKRPCLLPVCDPCSEIYTPPDVNGCPSCPTCRPITTAGRACPQLKCAAPTCPNVTYLNFYSTDCCPLTNCDYECQPSLNCPNLVCRRCPDGEVDVPQIDANGCYLCPKCTKCLPRPCPFPICEDACHELVTPKDENGCDLCPECQPIKPTGLCSNKACVPPTCPYSAYLDYYSSDCCPSNNCDYECQPVKDCQNLVCRRCPDGQVPVPQIDSNGCYTCPECKQCLLKPCALPQCTACQEVVPTTDADGCPDCPKCQQIKPTGVCSNRACLPPTCPYSAYLDYYSSDCCPSNNCNYECQPVKDCPSLVCRRCPDGQVPVPQFDSNGCYTCPECKQCFPKPCAYPLCSACQEVVQTTDADGCPGCPKCQQIQATGPCNRILCAPPTCPNKTYVNFYSATCCPLNNCDYKCQPSTNCPTLTCRRCGSGEVEVPQIDKNGCYSACPKCTKCPLRKCVAVECENKCYEQVTLPDKNGCPGCPTCQRIQPTACPLGLCIKPTCPNKTYVNYYTSNCCPPNNCQFDCQPKDTCPTIQCLKCDTGEKTILQTDDNGCRACPTCEPI